MYNNSKVAKAIRLAMMFGAGAAAAISAPAFAADEGAEEVEKIEVTGSRIKQVDLENSSPVTVITAADISLSGSPTVADVLNNLSANAFGSWTGVSGYGAGAAASSSINLRGLGSDATLVLLDGRRMPGTSSSSGSSADTSLIPMSIVERIEILRDGASAVYGSAAVAGVINIITKKDFDGVHAKYEFSSPKIDGGESQSFTLTTGFTSDKGNIVFTYEHSESDAVYDRDLWPVYDADVYSGYSSYSPVTNYFSDAVGDDDWKSNSALCADAPDVVDTTDGANNGRCKYNYGAVTKFYPDNEKNSIFTQFSYEMTDDINFVGRAMASINETDSRYAATPVSTAPIYMQSDNPMFPTGDTGTKVRLYTRAAPIGARDTKTEVVTSDVVFGFEGAADIGLGLDWEVNYQNSLSITNSFGQNLVNDVAFQAQVDSGNYDIFNNAGKSFDAWNADMKDMYQEANHTGTYQGRYASQQIDGLVSTTFIDEGDFILAGVVGVEYEKIDFSQKSDPESANGFVSGGSGGDDVDATRDRTAAYVEIQMALPMNFDISLAGRYEKYEQEGDVGRGISKSTFDKVVPKIGLTWRPMEDLLLRSSWGQSFRAPNMGEMFQSDALSFPTVRDTAWCDANPGQDESGYCSNAGEQVATWFGGNENLTEETGDSVTIGGVWDVLDNLSVEVTYYAINYDNKIDSVSNSEILRIEQENGGLGQYPSNINRGSSGVGKIEDMKTTYINKSSLSTDGLDFALRYTHETSFGDFAATLNASYVMSFEEKAEADSKPFDSAGLQDFPDLKSDLTIGYSYEDFTATWTTFYVAAQDSGNEEWEVDYLADIPTYVKHNLQVAYTAPTRTRLTLGVNNLTDEEAPSQYLGFRDYRDVSWSLYDLTGRTVYFRIEQSF
ncbi:MAG: TonB-dependent receptor [Colwellia sp.]|uniref:TonB-dependent receptor n=1 Tax=Colwellia sp. TaxID=56799 RepID=UPI0025C272E1|nr:TonB-dependent receptor [Colwellia sp.]NQZ24803.1 TonB-dependent receptor [Colwellia sp.]